MCNFMKPTKRYSLFQVELSCCLSKSESFNTMKEVHWYCCTKSNLTMQEMMFIEMKKFNNMINVPNPIHQKMYHGYMINIQNN